MTNSVTFRPVSYNARHQLSTVSHRCALIAFALIFADSRDVGSFEALVSTLIEKEANWTITGAVWGTHSTIPRRRPP